MTQPRAADVIVGQVTALPHSLLKLVLSRHRDRIPKDEHVTIAMMGSYTDDEPAIRLSRTKGLGLDCVHRFATSDIPRKLLFGDRSELVDAVCRIVAYLVTMLFPRPLPRFRIRRDARWGRA